ncbi:hypothetical protein, partial [Moorena sp. SIO2C4]|uniref:hypothetical protein n=1 Tax=Moorena sp. SIO2C4 TaxID=2607824 RepID=UPI0013CA1691
PKGWKPSGKRVRRGLYETAKGYLINADTNGAANIARKVATQLPERNSKQETTGSRKHEALPAAGKRQTILRCWTVC